MATFTLFLHSKLFLAALAGFWAGVAVDYHAFLSLKTPGEFLAYNWNVAAFRGFQGAVAGLVTALGMAQFS